VVAVSQSARWRRSTHRVAHLLLAAVLGVFVYSPLRTAPDAVLVVQVVVFPLLVVSGLLLWRGVQVRRWLRDR
jgi:thiosulfate reductase cytochrome b subunit